MTSSRGYLFRLVFLALLIDSINGLQAELFLSKYSESTTDYFNALSAYLINHDQEYFDIIMQANQKNEKLYASIKGLLTDVLKNISSHVHTLSINDLSERKNFKNIILLDGYTSFLKLYPYLEKHGKNQAGHYLFVLVFEPGMDFYNIIKKIMTKMFERNLLKIIILVRSENNTMDFYTFNLFTTNSCRKIIPIRFNRMTNGKMQIPMKFPLRRCQNLNKCTLKVFTWKIPPFMMFGNEATLEKNTLNFTGFEGEILKIVAQKLNFTIKLLTDPNYFWGSVYSKENMTGPFELLRNRTVDIKMGYVIYRPSSVSSLEFSQSYYVTKLIGLVQRYGIIENNLWIYESFQEATWLLLLLCFLILFLIMYKSTPQKDRTFLWLSVLAQLLGMPIIINFKTRKFYYLFPVFGICFLVLRSAYLAKIFEIFNTEHFKKPPATVTDLILQNYTIYAVRPYTDPVSGRTFLQTATSDPSGDDFYKLLGEIPLNDKVAAVVSQTRLIHFARGTNLHELFEPISEIVQMHTFCAYFSVGSCISNPFNEIISRLLSAGIIDKWISYFKADSSSFEQFRRNMQKFKQPVPLSVEKLSLVFMLFGIGLSIALMVFISELLYVHLLKRQ